MKASLHYVVRNLGRRRLRTFLGILGIFLTLAFLTAIQIGLDSIANSYTDLAALQAGKADLVVTAEGGSLVRPEPFFEGEIRRKLDRNPHLRGVAPRWTGVVQAEARVRAAEAAVAQALAQRARAVANANLQREDFARQKTLFASGAL